MSEYPSTAPAELHTLCTLIRSKNAGPFTLTIDVMFYDVHGLQRVLRSGVLSVGQVASIYSVPEDTIRVFVVESALALKISFPRPVPSGSIHDTDIYGGQFHAPLVQLVVP
jgi:hypothetical protein